MGPTLNKHMYGANTDRAVPLPSVPKEEGIIVKDLGSVWAPGDRRGTWVKLKPDYVHNSEIDAVIIAGCHGAGRRGGGEMISEYILGLADGPRGPGGAPPRFLSFAKCAS